MPILVIMLIVALVAYFAYRYFYAASAGNDQATLARRPPSLVNLPSASLECPHQRA